MAAPSDEADSPHYHGHRDRLRERYLAAGGEALPDYELLELLLYMAIPRRDIKPLAKSLITRFGDFAGVVTADVETLQAVDGVGRNTAIAIRLVGDAAVRMARQQVLNKPVLNSWQRVLDYCAVAMARGKAEQFRLLFLDKRNVLIADEVQQRGTVDHAPVYPREVVKRALELGATALILVHNHPSGDPTPSRADIDMTKALVRAAEGVGVVIHDHLIVGLERTASFKQLGLL